MNKVSLMAVVALLAAGVQTMRAQQTSAQIEKLLASAQHKATVDGDLKGAIEDYKKIVAGAGANRAVTAQALVRMAECYQKLGDAESRRIYERLVREFGDQKDAVAVARARLGNREPAAATRGDRPVWTGPAVDMFGQVSPDGRFITFVDWANSGNVMVHDIATNSDRAITPKTSWKESEIGEGGWSTVSRDGRQIAYAWTEWDRLAAGARQTDRKTIQIAPLDDAGRPPSRQLYQSPDEIDFVYPFDWSPDGRWLAVLLENRKEGAFQIGTVAVRDGTSGG